MSANSIDPQGNRPPTWYDFLQKAKAQLPSCPSYITKSISSYKYLDACEYLRELLGQRWSQLILDTFHRPGYQPARIHKHIFDLDCRIVASLNFDRIYDTYATGQSDGTYIIKNYFDDDIGRASSGPDRYLLKLHGSIDHPDKLIFSTTDYARARNKNQVFYRILDALIATHTFFIIGCGINDPDAQILFENYRYSYNLENHYMAHSRPIKPLQKELLLKSRGISVLEYSAANGHLELTESLEGLVKLVSDRRDQIAGDQNW